MYLSNLKLWNFRKFGSKNSFNLETPDLDLNFLKGLNVLIGENDSGKSAIIDAIKLVLKTHSFEWLRVEDDDFFEESDRFRIEIKFEDLKDEEAKNFTEWLGWDGIGENAKPFLRLIYDVKRKDGRLLPAEVKAGVDNEGYQLTAEAREYLKVTYLKPLRDAKAEFIPRRNSRLSQILQEHHAFKGKDEEHDLTKEFAKFNQSIVNYFDAKNSDGNDINDVAGKELKDSIDGFVKELYDSAKESHFSVAEGKLKSILEKLELSIKDETNPGLGTLNRLCMATELLHLEKENWSGVRLGLIEELEAHLHPQAQMRIIESLQEKENIQLILTTHSPNLASKVKLDNLIICNNGNAFPMGEGYTELNPGDYKFLEKFLDTTKANLFFAKGVILVEGWAEELLIPALAKSCGYNLTEKGVSVVNVASTAFLRYSKIFRRKNEPFMVIPVAVITDLDVKPTEEKIEKDDGRTNKESALQDKPKNYDGQKVKTFVSPHWTLEYCLLKSETLGNKFQEIAKDIHSRTDWSDFENELTKKLENKGLDKTDIAYRLSKHLEELTTPLNIDKEDTANYLIKAIKHACGNKHN